MQYIKEGLAASHEAIEILGNRYGAPEALVMMLAIGMQESKFDVRRQIVSKKGKLVAEGPATSFWQMEQGGGVRGVMKHTATEQLCRRLCAVRDVSFSSAAIWHAMQFDDVLGAGMARLLLLSDPGRLPKIGEQQKAWDLYKDVWRPGAPHPDTWPTAYTIGRKELGV